MSFLTVSCVHCFRLFVLSVSIRLTPSGSHHLFIFEPLLFIEFNQFTPSLSRPRCFEISSDYFYSFWSLRVFGMCLFLRFSAPHFSASIWSSIPRSQRISALLFFSEQSGSATAAAPSFLATAFPICYHIIEVDLQFITNHAVVCGDAVF